MKCKPLTGAEVLHRTKLRQALQIEDADKDLNLRLIKREVPLIVLVRGQAGIWKIVLYSQN